LPPHINLTQPEWVWEKPARDCPDDHLSGYQPCVTLLNISDPMGTGAFNVVIATGLNSILESGLPLKDPTICM
jgi:hypothetical protein